MCFFFVKNKKLLDISPGEVVDCSYSRSGRFTSARGAFRGLWVIPSLIISLAMKLHLPSGLRRALLACLAALSLPASGVATTIASASGIAAAFAALSARVQAEDITVTSVDDLKEKWNDGSKNVAENTFKYNHEGDSGNDYFDDARTAPKILNAGLNLQTDLTINNGFSGKLNEGTYGTYQFEGAISGTGNFNLDFTRNSIGRQKYIFHGDMSAWEGNFISSSGAGDNVLEFSGENFRSSTGNITFTAGNNSTLLVDGVELKNASIQASKLQLKNNVTFSGQQVTISGEITIDPNASLTLGENVTMTTGTLGADATLNVLSLGANSSPSLNADTHTATITTLTLASGSHLTLGGGQFSVGSLDLSSGGQVTLTHGKLTIQGGLTTDDSHRLEIVYNATNSAQLHLSEGWSGICTST